MPAEGGRRRLGDEVVVAVRGALIAVAAAGHAARYLLEAYAGETGVLLVVLQVAVIVMLVATHGGRAPVDEIVVEGEALSVRVRRIVHVVVMASTARPCRFGAPCGRPLGACCCPGPGLFPGGLSRQPLWSAGPAP